VSYLQDVKSTIQIRSLDGKTIHATYSLDPGASYGLFKAKADHEFFFAFESILIPKRVYRFDFKEHPNSPSVSLNWKLIQFEPPSSTWNGCGW